ncbi:MAG TPA: ABC transporter permease [Acidimicrobiales bacterium]|nr:ABC transporter permease [Acidimicrobiales bacterium]
MIPILRINLRRAGGDRRYLIVATVFPVLFILVTGLLAGSPKEPIGLLRPSARLVQLVAHTPSLKVRIEPNRAQLSDDILRGRVVGGLITLPAAPGHQRVQFVSQSASTGAVQTRTDVVALLDLIAAEGARTKVTDVTLAHTDVPAALSPFSYVAPADLVLFLGITVMLLASGAVETRRLGVMHRIAAAPVRRRTVVAALVTTSLCVAAGQSVGLLVVGRLIFGVHWGNPLGVFLVLAMLSLAYSGATALVSVRSRTEEQAISVAVVLGILCGLLGGCMYPLDVVSPAIRVVGHFVPQAWAMDAFIKLIYDHVGLASVLPEVGVLAIFAAILSALALRAYARTVYSPG